MAVGNHVHCILQLGAIMEASSTYGNVCFFISELHCPYLDSGKYIRLHPNILSLIRIPLSYLEQMLS